MIDISAVFANYLGGPFPSFTGKNATGAGATDGTEWIRAYIDNFGFGWTQALLDYMGLTPDGTTEAAGSSQIVDAMGMFMPVGCPIEWNRANDPATDGLRFLLLNGQGILRANYADLDAAVYVGDGNNAAVAAAGGAYYHADNADGSSPNTAGVYLILPDRRGTVPRGLDLAASIDPDGASRYLGDFQQDAGQTITGVIDGIRASGDAYPTLSGVFVGSFDYSGTTYGAAVGVASFQTDNILRYDSSNSTSPNAAKTNDVETRVSNTSTQWAVRY